MKQEVKKLLIRGLPYLLFVYLFDKIGAAIRLTPGADASEKLLQLGTGFAAAFSSIAPSLHPADLLIGIAGAVIIRLAVYMKGKNAKKYRKGMEYGSARWGGAEVMQQNANLQFLHHHCLPSPIFSRNSTAHFLIIIVNKNRQYKTGNLLLYCRFFSLFASDYHFCVT